MSKTKTIDVYYKDRIVGRGEITYDEAHINICHMYVDGIKLSVLYIMDLDYGVLIPNHIYNKIQDSIKLDFQKNEGGVLQ